MKGLVSLYLAETAQIHLVETINTLGSNVIALGADLEHRQSREKCGASKHSNGEKLDGSSTVR